MTDSSKDNVIGLVGYPGSGKDALAEALCLDHNYCRLAFGDAVKYLLMEIDPIYTDMETLEVFKREGIASTRQKLQRLGQAMRDRDKEYWLDRMPTTLYRRAVCTDIRYWNELDYVKSRGGTIIAIERPGYGPINGHISERNTGQLIAAADLKISNNDTLRHLVAQFLTVA